MSGGFRHRERARRVRLLDIPGEECFSGAGSQQGIRLPRRRPGIELLTITTNRRHDHDRCAIHERSPSRGHHGHGRGDRPGIRGFRVLGGVACGSFRHSSAAKHPGSGRRGDSPAHRRRGGPWPARGRALPVPHQGFRPVHPARPVHRGAGAGGRGVFHGRSRAAGSGDHRGYGPRHDSLAKPVAPAVSGTGLPGVATNLRGAGHVQPAVQRGVHALQAGGRQPRGQLGVCFGVRGAG